ncbi:GntR family transcriptional regulator [Paenibacillus radicis (ex Xue et al. 2023)]|uniref:GntR family transcriptional regulator n=1 Tax=Paenibacillus radicis (ex Xue et al. 2023) TaxID=2972489 RepID=A0ABT1YAR6_9BACL|nr:GntR family transcriptional regulator [Paenibacillus radicis (ex Xue et al. 2023)]MCR8630289.1 GntR family transcriptional regulator [Paenibacillus radicis (ex Xue et al. 2023)]
MSEEIDIMDHLIEEIQRGKYDPDDKLPSENELADLFRVPRMTARKAYVRLQELGYVYSKQGKGSFVQDRHLRIPLILSGHVSFSQKMIEQGYDYQSKNIFCEPIDYNNKIYQSLGAEEQDRVFKVGRLRIIEGQAIALHISYVAESMFSEIERTGRGITSMFEFYKSQGFTEFRSTQTLLSVIYPSKYERELLACSSLIPLLVLESECLDSASGRTLEYSRILYRADYFTYVI